MFTVYTIIQIVVACLVIVLCLTYYFLKQGPNDYTIGGVLFTELLLLGQIIVSLVAAANGNPPLGDPLEFGLYAFCIVLLPLIVIVWVVSDRQRWNNLLLAAVEITVIIMLWRMSTIWYGSFEV